MHPRARGAFQFFGQGGQGRAVLLAALASLGALGLTASPAVACGGLVSPNGSAEMGGFSALISFDGAKEDLIAGVLYQNAHSDGFGWLMPLPSAPQITPGDPSGLTAAQAITEPPHPSALHVGGAGAPGSSQGVTELGRTTVQGLEFVTLAAGDTAALATWMTTHGFVFHDRQQTSVQGYLDRHWVVVVARAAPGTAPANGVIWVRMQFTSANLTYPMAIAGANHPGTLSTTVFVVTPYRPQSQGLAQEVQRPDDNGYFASPGSRLELRYSAQLQGADATRLSASVSVPQSPWLTRYDSLWNDTDLATDLVLTRSPDQSPIDYAALQNKLDRDQATTRLIIAALIIGFIVVVAGAIAAGVVLLVVLPRRR